MLLWGRAMDESKSIKTNVSFESAGLKLAGHLFTVDPDTSPSLPAIVVGPPGSSVKEQAAEKLLILVEVRRNEIAEFDRTGRKVSIVDPSYS